MLEAILSTLKIMGWLGVILGILVIVNTICGTMVNLNNGQEFSWKKMGKGLLKALIFYIGASLTGIAFTMLPYINEMITDVFGTMLISKDLLNTLSSVAVLTVVVATVIIQAKKALEGIVELSNMSSKEIITWEVVDPETDKPKEEVK